MKEIIRLVKYLLVYLAVFVVVLAIVAFITGLLMMEKKELNMSLVVIVTSIVTITLYLRSFKKKKAFNR